MVMIAYENISVTSASEIIDKVTYYEGKIDRKIKEIEFSESTFEFLKCDRIFQKYYNPAYAAIKREGYAGVFFGMLIQINNNLTDTYNLIVER